MSITAIPAISENLAIEQICRLLRQWCGVTLDESKHYLVRNRLRPVMNDFQINSLPELLTRVSGPACTPLRDRVIDALTTHETLFFRDASPFDMLEKYIVPEIRLAAGKSRPRLRVWSAACSTGQEPYSIAIRLMEAIPLIDNWDVSILASDVSNVSVEQAKQGIYQDHELRRGMTPELQRKYFDGHADAWKVQDRVRRLIQFQPGNLLAASQPSGPFDLIFCRNVAIYFDMADRQRVFRMLASKLVPRGRLIVGCSEVLTDMKDVFETERLGAATCYRKVGR